ncbi:MAG: TonB family protein [Gammaproteobacteria bacterium]|nr:TonB family protein [Gammaproteobacteria bacterium]MDH3415292.1 TonB family protein [Gammaproteobacteria bacterium]
MSLEQFKKQVLLLHSEQSTLDNLSTGFNDRYTVHCATSGSEALNTLGQTEIDVIVTAQELPGMSGLDALREAKKRSPDTIGILLAGDENDGLEAMVGDKEVFQIVRGDVTPASLKNLIDGVTRQARLLTLAESANDTTANVDEPTGEHIIMETSENGSTIISDGTGRLPILDPARVSASADVGSRAVDVLVLTQDEEFLTTVKESARGLHNVIYANTVAQADEAVRKNKVGVAVVDAAMVGTNAEDLTMHLRAASRRLVAIVAGRRDDGEMLMDLINRGKVYRFLLKPVSPGRSRLAIEASVKHHLEAPDSAFIIPGAAAAKAKPQAAPKPKPEAQPKPEAKKPAAKKRVPPRPAPPPTAARPQKPKAVKSPPAPEPAAAIIPKKEEAFSPDRAGLTEAFGGDDTSLTETMTGIVSSVGKSVSSLRKPKGEKRSVPEAKPASASSGGSLFANPKAFGIGAGVLLAVVGISYWIFSGPDEQAAVEESAFATPSFSESDSEFETTPPADADTNISDLLEEARLATTAGQLFNPPGGNAIELYWSALQLSPDDSEIAAELNAAIEQSLSLAESAMLENRVEDATAALQRIALVRPGNPRLPFLNAQLAQIQLRNYLDDARLGIRESRFEDARFALDGARSLVVTDASEIDAVADELSAALSSQRVGDVLEKANARLEEGSLIAPSNDNARYYFELALSNDPDNAAARQGLAVIASKLVLQARTQIDARNFDEAESLLADARRLDPSSSELITSTAALQTARDQLAQQRAAAAQKAANKRAADKRAADKRATDKLAAEKLAAEQAAAEQRAANERAAKERELAEQQAADALAADESSSVDADTAAADAPQQASPAVNENAPVAVSSLQRIKYVAPKYPRAAQRRNISGWVDVIFTVDIDGSVTNISIRDSDPGDTFVSSATNAVEAWKFEPVMDNGVAIQKRAAVRMMFALE